jgi:hypothetical protein
MVWDHTFDSCIHLQEEIESNLESTYHVQLPNHSSADSHAVLDMDTVASVRSSSASLLGGCMLDFNRFHKLVPTAADVPYEDYLPSVS